MKTVSLWLVALVMGGVGCRQVNSDTPANSANADDRPQVVSTSTMITDWTTQIAEEEIDLTGILQPGVDPHIYEPVPQDTQALEEAELILYNGYDLEPGLIRLMEAAGVSARKLPVGEVIQPLQLDKANSTVPDPHVWGSVENTIAMVETIRDTLIELSPTDETLFRENADRYIAELEQLHTWIQQQIATIPASQRQLITTHDAFQYYGNTYGLEIPGTLIGISTEEQPSAQTVQQLVERIQALNVPTIFAETTINPRLITTVAEEANIQLADQPLYSDSIGAPGSNADTYVKMMVANTQSIVENLGGQYTPFRPNAASSNSQ